MNILLICGKCNFSPPPHPTNPANIFGFGTWVQWGSGRVPVGVNTSDGNYNSVEKTGGSSTHSHSFQETAGLTNLTVEQLPNHSHSIPSLSGSTNTAGNHNHYSGYGYHGTQWRGVDDGGIACVSWEYYSDDGSSSNRTSYAGNHSHSITTNSSTTGGNGGGKAHTHTLPNTNSSSSLQPYITCYMWKRTA